MELKYLWCSYRHISLHCSNRTFMELKSRASMSLWGWRCSSNRTFMELKSAKAVAKQEGIKCSNRTFMELKYKMANNNSQIEAKF